MSKPPSFKVILARYPPVLCRLMAKPRRENRPLTLSEIASGSGLTVEEVEWISLQTDWSQVTVRQLYAFTKGCRCDLSDICALHRIANYLRNNPTWRYLRKSGHWTTIYEPLAKRYLASLAVTSSK